MKQKRYRDTQFPKALSTKRAHAWLSEHPNVDKALFWLDQQQKHWKRAMTWMIVALCGMSVSLVMQVVALILRMTR